MITKVECILGIDPGRNGGIAVYLPQLEMVRVQRMPERLEDLRDMLQYYADEFVSVAFVEKLSIRKSDMADNPGKIFGIEKMLENFNQIKTTLEFVGVPFVQVHPMTWQSKLGVRKSGEEKADRKRRYKEIAAELYPGCQRVTLWNADALLIMHFGRKMIDTGGLWLKSNIPSRYIERLF